MLDAAPLPAFLRPLWDAFMSLAALRRSGMDVHTLTWTDIAAWVALMGLDLTPWELDTLMAMEARAMKTIREQQAQQRKPKTKK